MIFFCHVQLIALLSTGVAVTPEADILVDEAVTWIKICSTDCHTNGITYNSNYQHILHIIIY